MSEKGCDTCMYKRAESRDEDGKRIVDCAANDMQMYSPLVGECVKWSAKLGSE